MHTNLHNLRFCKTVEGRFSTCLNHCKREAGWRLYFYKVSCFKEAGWKPAPPNKKSAKQRLWRCFADQLLAYENDFPNFVGCKL